MENITYRIAQKHVPVKKTGKNFNYILRKQAINDIIIEPKRSLPYIEKEKIMFNRKHFSLLLSLLMLLALLCGCGETGNVTDTTTASDTTIEATTSAPVEEAPKKATRKRAAKKSDET